MIKRKQPVPGLLVAISLVFLIACSEQDTSAMVGTIERDRIEITTESAEPITKIHVKEGQKLAAGDPIIEQDSRRLQARLQQFQAESEGVSARLAELQRGPRPEVISQARAALEASRVERENAAADYARAREIFERNLSNQADVDHARARAESTSARYDLDRAALEALLNGTTAEELAQAETAVTSAAAKVREAELNLHQLSLVAPMDSLVDTLLFEPGERPRPGEPMAILLADQAPYARIYVPQSSRASVTAGTMLAIRTRSGERVFNGTVRWISADPSFTPYFALTEHDSSRLSYLAEVDFQEGVQLPAGTPVTAELSPAQE